MTGLFRFLKGCLRIRFSGDSGERLLNLCAIRGIELWDLICRDGMVYAWIRVDDFRKLRPIVRKTRVKVAVLEKDGLPFLFPRIMRQWSFLLGALLALVFWIASSFFLWEINCNGNVQITKDQLLSFLKTHGIEIGDPIAELDLSWLERELRKEFPQIIWTSMKRDGTRLIIDVKENDLVERETQMNSTEKVGTNLVSSYDGKVVSLIVREGVPKVKIGDTVTEGQVLVEGAIPILADDGSIRDYVFVNADADVCLEHLIKYTDSVELTHLEKKYTGRERKDYFVSFFGQRLMLKFQGIFHKETEIMETWSPAVFEKLEIPIILGRIRHDEYLLVMEKYGKEEEEALISEKIMEILETFVEKGVQIVGKDVKIDTKDGVVYVYGEFVVQETLHGNTGTEE